VVYSLIFIPKVYGVAKMKVFAKRDK